jgi:catechol 2,3-dioxygenase-like lactoylglutathione lyase family enzyme
MSITLLYGCFHIELAVRDLDAARGFMETALGAAVIEQKLAGDLRALVPDGYLIDHVDCGSATFQLNQPSRGLAAARRSIHQHYLDEVGPCVTNLNFYVDDIAHARALLSDRGAETVMEGPTSIVNALSDYGPVNTRPGPETRRFLYLGSRQLIGFDLEIMEPNFLRFADQTAQQPCFVGPRPGSGLGLRLQRLTIAVPDLATTYRNLLDLLAPGSRSTPYAERQTVRARAFRITVGGIELEYCQPLGTRGPLAAHLARYGSGVIAIAFGAADLGAVIERVRVDGSIRVSGALDLVGDGHADRRWQLPSRELLGFDIVLEELASARSAA